MREVENPFQYDVRWRGQLMFTGSRHEAAQVAFKIRRSAYADVQNGITSSYDGPKFLPHEIPRSDLPLVASFW